MHENRELVERETDQLEEATWVEIVPFAFIAVVLLATVVAIALS